MSALTLYQLPPALGLPVSVSPFCTKVELYLRITGHEFATEPGDPRKSPNGMVPFLDGIEGQTLADSEAILERLESRRPALDQGLGDSEREEAGRLRELAERDLYFPCLYSRFVEPGGWAHQHHAIRAMVPWGLAWLLVPLIRRSQVKKCAKHGCTDDGCYAMAVAAMDVIEEALAEGPYLLGEHLRTIDCAVVGQLLHTAWGRSPTPARSRVRGSAALMGYVRRVVERAEIEMPPLGD